MKHRLPTLSAALLGAAIGITLTTLTAFYIDTPTDKPNEANRLDGIYPKSGTVIAVNHDEDTVTFADHRGDVWSFYGAEDWMEGDRIAVIMDDNGTPVILDDLVISARYEGHAG